MKFLYHLPSVYTISAARTYLNGYRNAILDMGHEFRILTADDDQEKVFAEYQPDIFMTSIVPFMLKYLNTDLLKKQKKKYKTKVLSNTPFWVSPMSKFRLNETASLKDQVENVVLIKSGFADVYYNVCEQGDPRMEGFRKTTGYPINTVLLAADKTLQEAKYDQSFAGDISFIGTYLPERREFMKKYVFPLAKKYDLRLYCQDLTVMDRTLNFAMKVGQFYNIPYLRSFKKNNVTFDQERTILKSSTICLNIHEDYQKRYGKDFNDRTFKIPNLGGFEICDEVESIRKYLKDGEEIVLAKDGDDWFEKIDYYIKHPGKRESIIKKGKAKVQKEHTYHNRVAQLIRLAKAA